MHFVYLGNKNIYSIFMTCCISLFYFPQIATYFRSIYFAVQTVYFSQTVH